jgi:benzoate/toluate 1,2-dioxygenase reductase component
MNRGKDETVTAAGGRTCFEVQVAAKRRLASHTVEIRFQRPKGFAFSAGQKISVAHQGIHRDYTLVNSPQDAELAICVRGIAQGSLSLVLVAAKAGDRYHISPAFGHFLYHPCAQPAVFVATGTGIAPFVAFVHGGAKNFHLLHGVRSEAELYYRSLLSQAADHYTPCLSGEREKLPGDGENFYGRVTDFLEHRLPDGDYDFYLCGRGEMLRDATRIIDRRFDGSRLYSELFF